MSKTVNGVLHTYYYAGGRLLRETYGSNTLDFAYDASGNPFSLTYNGTKYYYVTNLQGDVYYLVDTSGNTVASYTYDPFGKVLTATGDIAEINPLRYRGYYYDTDSGFYYLQSRYYDPNPCRFINADSYASTGQGFVGNNMFAYCNNNPTNYLDADGRDAIWVQEGESASGNGHSGLIVQDEDGNWWYFYWGPIDENADIPSLVAGVKHGCFFVMIDTEGYDMHNTEDVIRAIAASDTPAATRAEKITATYYFSGDYVDTYKEANVWASSELNYELLSRNCLQVTLSAFQKSDSRFSWVPYGFINYIVPNEAAKKVAMIPSEKEATPWKLILHNIFLER